MNTYLQKAKELLGHFTECKLEQIPRDLNTDTLARLISVIDFELDLLILVELLNESRTNISKQVLAIQSGDFYMTSIVKYLKGDSLLDNQLDA